MYIMETKFSASLHNLLTESGVVVGLSFGRFSNQVQPAGALLLFLQRTLQDAELCAAYQHLLLQIEGWLKPCELLEDL